MTGGSSGRTGLSLDHGAQDPPEARLVSGDKALVESALRVREQAYAPYSRFRVGAALLAASGRVYTGCNVENASYPLTICAERAAVAAAVSEGERKFQAIAIASVTGATPCGACRQVLSEFGGPDGSLRVLVADTAGSIRAFTIAELLPEVFTPDQLG